MGPGLTNTTSDCRCGVVFAFWVLGWEVCVQSIISTCEGVGLSGNGLWNVWFEDFYFLMLFCILINFIYNRKNSGMAWCCRVTRWNLDGARWSTAIFVHSRKRLKTPNTRRLRIMTLNVCACVCHVNTRPPAWSCSVLTRQWPSCKIDENHPGPWGDPWKRPPTSFCQSSLIL